MIRFHSVCPGFVALGAVCALLTVAAPGRAQLLKKGERPLALKVGVLFPTTSNRIEPHNGDTFYESLKPASFTLGASYDLGKTRATLRPFVYSVYADVFTDASATRADEGPFQEDPTSAKATNSGYGLGVMGRLYPVPFARFYVGAGLGVYPMHGKVKFYSTDPRQPSASATYSHTETGLGGKLFLGWESKINVFGELEWDKTPDVKVNGNGHTLYDSRMSGLRLNIGYRL